MLIRKLFDKKGIPILATVFLVLFVAESRRQLRKRKSSRLERGIINTAVSLPAFSLLRLLFLPLMVSLAKKSGEQKWGISNQYRANPLFKGVVAFLIMDYGNYLWHIMNHKSDFLWRFHLVHHTDVDMDVTTALRFHFGEMIGSIFARGFFIFLSGATAKEVLMYEILFEAATEFHHSNLRLPKETERILNYFIVTPRMHGIHHSQYKNETDSNYSVIFSFWDRLHRTALLDIAQERIVVGVPSYRQAEDLTIGALLKLPFSKIRTWPVNYLKRN